MKSYLGNFYRHLAILIWSHWLRRRWLDLNWVSDVRGPSSNPVIGNFWQFIERTKVTKKRLGKTQWRRSYLVFFVSLRNLFYLVKLSSSHLINLKTLLLSFLSICLFLSLCKCLLRLSDRLMHLCKLRYALSTFLRSTLKIGQWWSKVCVLPSTLPNF